MSEIYEKKWAKFLRRVQLFRYVPFAEMVLAYGSLVTGKLKESSDFDVVVGVRKGRIFTNRFFAILIFSLFGYFNRYMHSKGKGKDKICLSHFVTESRYKLAPPYNPGWHELYNKMVLIMGDEGKADKFFKANDWVKPYRVYKRDERYLGNGSSWLKSGLELLLGGWFGDLLEKLKFIQIAVVKKGLPEKMPKGSRFVCNDDELEFHMDSDIVYKKWQARRDTY